MLLRSIRSSLGRYLAILAIVALGIGFFAGLKTSMPAMVATADEYLRAQRLQDFQLLSTLGFTAGDAEAFEELECVTAAEGAYFCDADAGFDGTRSVWHFMSITEKVSVPRLTAGRMPASAGECLGDERAFSRSDIGRTVTLSPDNEEDTLDLFARESYTIVGLAKSPRYISSDRGVSSLGTGAVEGFILLTPEGFDSEVYHELLVWCALPGAIYSEEYAAARDRIEPRIKALLNARGALRRAELWNDAQAELTDARNELTEGWAAYYDGRAEADRELSEALSELEDARSELDDGWAEVNEGQRQLDDGIAQVNAGLATVAANRSTLNASRAELNAGYAQLQAGYAQLEAGQAELDAGRAEIEAQLAAAASARAELEAGQAQLDAQWAELAQTEAQLAWLQQLLDGSGSALTDREQELRDALEADDTDRYAALDEYYENVMLAEAQVYLIQEQIAALEADGEDAAALYAQLEEANAALAEAQAAAAQAEAAYQPGGEAPMTTDEIIAGMYAYAGTLEETIAAGEAQAAAGRAQLEAAQTELSAAFAELEAGEAQLAAALAELEAGQTQSDAARATLQANQAALDAAAAELTAGETELDAAESELNAALNAFPAQQRQLSEARAELNDGEADYAEGLREYNDAKADAERELAEAEQELLDGERELIDAELEVEEQLRLEVYTLNRSANQGYVTFENDTSIIDAISNAFPVFFALIAALVCVTTMTRMVNEERTLIGTMKAMGYSGGAIMGKYLAYAGSSSLLGCVAGFFLGTWVIPRVISAAYAIMYTYERLGYYFSPGMYAACLAVAVPGTLLATWLACRRELAEKPAELIRPKAPRSGRRILLERIRPLWRRLSFLSKVTLRNAFRHRIRVVMMLLGIGGCTALMVAGFGIRDSVTDLARYQYEEIFHYDLAVTLDAGSFASDSDASALWAGETSAAALCYQDAVTLLAGDGEMSTHVTAAPPGALEDVISLHDKSGPIAWPGSGEAVLCRKLADRLDLKVGDAVTLRLEDGQNIVVRVTGVCENYLGHYVYVSADTAGEPRNNTALLRAAAGTDADRLAARLRAEEGVEYVAVAARERETMEQSMASLDLLVVLLIVCSGILAFITLYNLTNINIMERTREIATVKVLGFFPGETAAYILRENLLLSFLGALIGLGLGKLLHRFVLELVDVEYLTIDIRISLLSYLWSFLITLVFAALTNRFMRFKLEKVDMAESLKSVE